MWKHKLYDYVVARHNKYLVGHSKHATFNIENATWNTDVLAAQNGTDVVMGETTYTKYVQIDLKEGTTAYDLPLPAVKKTGATMYIGTIYGTQKDGDYVNPDIYVKWEFVEKYKMPAILDNI